MLRIEKEYNKGPRLCVLCTLNIETNTAQLKDIVCVLLFCTFEIAFARLNKNMFRNSGKGYHKTKLNTSTWFQKQLRNSAMYMFVGE